MANRFRALHPMKGDTPSAPMFSRLDGLDVKSLQYLMGHSNASVTLDVYTHSSFESVERAFEQIAGNL